MKSLKELFCKVHSGSWCFTRVQRTRTGDRYIFEARTRFFKGFESQNSFFKIVSKKYADRLCMEYFGKKPYDLNAFRYH